MNCGHYTGSTRRIYFDEEMGDALTAGWTDSRAMPAFVLCPDWRAPVILFVIIPSLRLSAWQSPCARPVASGPRTRPTMGVLDKATRCARACKTVIAPFPAQPCRGLSLRSPAIFYR